MKKVIQYVFVVALVCVAFGAKLAQAQEGARKVEIHAKRFSFVPAEITVKKGETITLALTSDDVSHSLVIEDLGIKGAMTKGQITNVTVTPSKVGTFQGKCGRFCGIGHGSMKFTVHVTDN
jgi:cytochrome c oxidase subunit 2